MIVLDASVVIELVLGTEAGREVARRIADPELTLHVPHLIDLEVAQVVRRYVLAGLVSVERGRCAIELLADLDLERHPHEPLLGRIWALRANLTAYDAAYVALAEILDAPLLTRDRRLAAASGHAAEVIVL